MKGLYTFEKYEERNAKCMLASVDLEQAAGKLVPRNAKTGLRIGSDNAKKPS